MKISYYGVNGLAWTVMFTSCHPPYRNIIINKNKTSAALLRPSNVLLNRIIDYRLEYNAWPTSRNDLTSKGIKYFHAFDNFSYDGVEFASKDINT